MLARRRADLRFAGITFLVALVGVLLALGATQIRLPTEWLLTLCGMFVGAVCILPRRLRKRAWRIMRSFASRRAEHVSASLQSAHVITSPRVVDGDTIDDTKTGVRYRLAGIDAPETAERARCFSERRHGELSKGEAISVIQAAKVIEARPTGRVDAYGRTVAYVYVDGVDLGDTLVRRGLARPWRSGRKPWCGSRGGMSKMARKRNAAWQCSMCGQRFEPRPTRT